MGGSIVMRFGHSESIDLDSFSFEPGARACPLPGEPLLTLLDGEILVTRIGTAGSELRMEGGRTGQGHEQALVTDARCHFLEPPRARHELAATDFWVGDGALDDIEQRDLLVQLVHEHPRPQELQTGDVLIFAMAYG